MGGGGVGELVQDFSSEGEYSIQYMQQHIQTREVWGVCFPQEN